MFYWRIVDLSLLFSCPVTSHSLRPHGLQHARPPCPHHILEFAQVRVHCISDVVQPSHPLNVEMRGKTRWPARKVAIQNYSEVWTSLKFYVLIGHDWEAGGKRLPTCPFLEHRASLEFFSHFFQSVRVLKPLRGEWARPKHTQSNRIPLPGPRDPGPPAPRHTGTTSALQRVHTALPVNATAVITVVCVCVCV